MLKQYEEESYQDTTGRTDDSSVNHRGSSDSDSESSEDDAKKQEQEEKQKEDEEKEEEFHTHKGKIMGIKPFTQISTKTR